MISPYFVDFNGINCISFLRDLENIKETFKKKIYIMKDLGEEENKVSQDDSVDSAGEVMVIWQQVRYIPPTMS